MIECSHGVMAITLDFESDNPGSTPGESYFFLDFNFFRFQTPIDL